MSHSALHHVLRAAAHEKMAKTLKDGEQPKETHPEVEGIFEGMNRRDAICLAAAIGTIAGGAIGLEHMLKIDPDVLFDAATMTVAHPLHVIYRRLSRFVI